METVWISEHWCLLWYQLVWLQRARSLARKALLSQIEVSALKRQLSGRWIPQQHESLSARIEVCEVPTVGAQKKSDIISPGNQSFMKEMMLSEAHPVVEIMPLRDRCSLDTPWICNLPNRFHVRTTAASRRSVPRHAQAHEPSHGPGLAEFFSDLFAFHPCCCLWDTELNGCNAWKWFWTVTQAQWRLENWWSYSII